MTDGDPRVRTRAGVLSGAQEAGVAVFRGVPFAEPPVGELRFAAPRPVRGWDGVREAVAYGPPPPQAGAFGMDGWTKNAGDDWLTLNVWAPEGASGLPVMVWIHGGGYVIGTSGLPEYDGGRLAREHGVVVVTFNYRLGVEGFAWIEGAPANRGLLDQVAALEWVRDNIRGFGGDPDRVTVFGESAGAGSIAALLAMDRAAGLFHRAVAQSVPCLFFSAELAAGIGAACAAELGLRPSVADLSTVAPSGLPAAGDAVGRALTEERWGRIGFTEIPFAPVVDGEVLTTTPWQALAEGAARDVELVVGHTRDEYRLFTALDGRLGTTEEEGAADALRALGPGPGGARAYREAFGELDPYAMYELVWSDWLFRMPSLRLAEAQVAGGGRAHVYELTWQGGGPLGACHGLDVPLVFGNLDTGFTAMMIAEGRSAEAKELSAHMRAAWTGFAAHGDPGWPAYEPGKAGEPGERLVQVLDTTPAVVPYPEEVSRRIWEGYRFGALGLGTA